MSGNSSRFNPAVLPAEFMKRFESKDADEPRHFLYPGQVFVTAEPITISTILGSCAAVCLWDMHKRAGGMNHYLLPEGPTDGSNRLRYGNNANQDLLEKIRALGCEVRHLRAKVFGGSSAFGSDPAAIAGIKERGTRRAVSAIAKAFHVVERDVSGKHGRRLLFRISDGVTLIKSFDQV
jgi:chemotaxis protein CheD